MNDENWRFRIGQIVYGLMFARTLDGNLVQRVTEDIVTRRSLREGPEAYDSAIAFALGSSEQLSTLHETKHSETELRDFLARVQQALEARRPWPEPSLVALSAARWPDFSHARAIGRINATAMGVSQRLRERFSRVSSGEQTLNVLLIRLATGEELALLAPAHRTVRGVLILADPSLPVTQILRNFTEATGFADTQVTLIS